MTYLTMTPEISVKDYNQYNIIETNCYSIEGYNLDEEYYKENNWLQVHVARKVGKSNIEDLTLEDYRSIEILNLPNKGIKYIPDEIGYMNNLKVLNLSGNEIKIIPKTVEYLFNLEELDLSNNKITSFSAQLVSLSQQSSNLKKINISNNILLFNLDNINRVSNNVNLDISQNPIKNVYAYKQLILNNKLNLECNIGDNMADIKKEISVQLRLYNTLTGDIERLPDELDISLIIDDKDISETGVFSKEGEFKLKVSIKDASLINGYENTSIIISDIPVIVKNSGNPNAENYNEKLIKVVKIKGSLKQEPYSNSQTLIEIDYGKELKVIGESSDFYKVQYETYLGYIKKSEVEDVKYSLKEVSSSQANVYILNNIDSPVFATIPKKQLVKVYSKNGEWSTILYSGKIMYMKSNDLVDTITYIGEIVSDKVKVRETPSDKANALGMMSKGDKVEVYESMNNGWYKIKYLDKIGYIKASEVKIASEVQIPGDNQNYGSSNLVQNPSNTIKPATGDDMGLKIVACGVSLLGLTLINKKKEENI